MRYLLPAAEGSVHGVDGVLTDVEKNRIHKHIQIQRGGLGAADGSGLTLKHTTRASNPSPNQIRSTLPGPAAPGRRSCYLQEGRLEELQQREVPVLEQPAVQLGGEVKLLTVTSPVGPLPEVNPRLPGSNDHELLLLR